MLERFLQAWRAIAPREQRLIAIAGAVVLLAIGYLALIEPAWQGREKLQRELPQLRQQLAQMSALAGEVRQLATVQSGGVTGQASLRAELEQSVKAAGLSQRVQKLEQNGELIDLRFKGVPFAHWLGWTESALRETRMRIADLSVTREAENGVVTVRMVIEAPKREAR